MRTLWIFMMVVALGVPMAKASQQEPAKIEIALLLDTSGSMQGLLNQARSRLWSLMNDLENARKDGQLPELRIALYEHGSSAVNAELGYLRMISDLTTDHSNIAAELFQLKTNGSEEYVGMAALRASEDLSWSKSDVDFRAIFVAGNETLVQGPVPVADAIAATQASDIKLNFIFAENQNGFGGCHGFHCHQPVDPTPSAVSLEWQNAAQLAGGSFAQIDRDSVEPQIDTPYDQQIVDKTKELNTTYLPFGPNGQQRYDDMINLDGQVGGSVGDYIDWGRYRSGRYYDVSSWDLVSATEDGDYSVLSTTPDNELPEMLRGLSLNEKIAIVEDYRGRRIAIQQEIQDLHALRADFIIDERQRRAQTGEADDLEAAMIDSLREQLRAKGFDFIN